MGVSIRGYARHRGVSDTAVRKAIKTGRITTEADGTIDIDKVDKQWRSNTNTPPHKKTSGSERKAIPKAALDAVDDTLRESGGHSTTFVQARTANEILKAQTNRLKLQQLKNELVDRAGALAHIYRLARSERDAWQSWPARISSQMAVELNVDPHTLHTLLERYIREHLSELSDIQPKVD